MLHRSAFALTYSLIFGALLTSLGCGGGETFGSEESERIALNITAIADAAENKKVLASLFVTDAFPENWQDYAARAYDVPDAAVIDGDTATVEVTITKANPGSAGEKGRQRRRKQVEVQPAVSDSSPSETVQWTLKKVGEEWKISDAPLPE